MASSAYQAWYVSVIPNHRLAPTACFVSHGLQNQVVRAALSDISEPFEMVEIFRNSEAAGAVVDDVLKLKNLPRFIWMQLGVVNEEAASRARRACITVIMDRCPKIELPRLQARSKL